MSWTQRFFTSIVPVSWAQPMEADSRQWFMKWLKRDYEESDWDLGGIR
jgi:hypothetical protein